MLQGLNVPIKQIKKFSQPAKLFLLATIVDGIVYSGWNLFFNFYMIERGFGRDFIGVVNGVVSLAMVLLGVPMGRISDRIGRKRAMVIGVAVSMAAMALEVTLTNPTLILAAAFVNGTAGALYFLSQAPFMMKASDSENRTLLFSLNFGLVTLSGAFGSLFAGQLPAFFGGVLGVTASSASAYQAVLLASVFLSVFTLVPLLLIKESKSDESKVIKPEKGVSLREVLRNPMTLKLSLPGLLIGSGAALLIPYLNLFFADKFQVSDETLGVLFSISALMTGVGSIVGPRLETGLGSKIRAVVFTQAGSLAFLLLMGFSPYMGLAIVGFLMRGTLIIWRCRCSAPLRWNR
ncbi:MFS transporter [bacterium]|nr:MAG: MFS transporter [bacterium]